MRIFKHDLMLYRKITVSILAILLLAFTAGAQILEPVKWSFSQKELSTSEHELIFKAHIDSGWHLYSQFIEQGGPIPTSFYFDENPAIELIGKTIEPEAHSEYDNNFKMELQYFSSDVVFTQKIKVLSNKATTFTGALEFMCCDDEQCLPPADVEFSFNLPANPDGKEIIVEDAASNETIPQTTLEEKAENDLADSNEDSLWYIFFIAFGAGLIAILTPCVFPMIPMTVSFFMHGGSKAKSRLEALFFGVSIIAIYTIIGTIVAVTLGANFANWLSTHWLPNILFFLIFIVFAFSFFGAFEITLPSWMVNRSDAKADKGGYSGAFFMAFTLVLVSFSCTGPIVGSILVASAGGEILKPIIGMFGFSLAFALPFAFFAFFPAMLANMPKSGGWLNSVKVVLGFLELALGLKFLSIADQTYHWGILDREVYLAFWIVIFALMGLYLLGKLRFAHDSKMEHLGVFRLMLAIITFTFVMYMIPGMWGAPLKALSGYMPPQQSIDFDMNKIVRDNIKTANFSAAGEEQSLCEKPKYADFLHLPHGLEGYFDYEQALQCSKEQNKPIFIDFTGHGCVNCREMEAAVWSDPKVLNILQNDYIVVALYVDDKSKLPEEEWIVSEYDGKTKKTIGKKYADFQISRFNVNAQPYYVLLDTEGNELVDPRAYDLDVDAFLNFLEDGLENFNKGK